MDPLSIATAAASIVGTAIKVSKGLYDTVEALTDVPSDVRALCSTVDSVKSAVSRLVRFMNDRDSCIWPDQWLEDVTNDIEAIGDELKEVQKFMEVWDTDGKGKAGKIKDAWRSWKWYFNAEEIQRCTRRLREAREDLGLQLGIIQMSTTAQTSQDVHQVKNIVGTIKAELAQKTSTYDNLAFNIELSAFAQQMSDLQDAILSLNKPDTWPPVNGYRADEDTPLSEGRIHTPPSIADADRNSFDPFTSNPPSPILSPLAALSQEAFLQNQQLPTILARSQENPISIAALSLKLSDMQRKYDQLTIYWDNALGQIAYLESEIDRYITANVPDRTVDTDTKDTSPSLLQGSEEVTSREAVIDVLRAQNEALEDMISNRVTIMGYKDDNLNARDLGKQLLKKREKVNRQQEEIDLLRWRLEGERSSLREQLKINKVLDDEVKLIKKKAGRGSVTKERGRWRGLLTPSPGREDTELCSTPSYSTVHQSSSPPSNNSTYRPTPSLSPDIFRPRSKSSGMNRTEADGSHLGWHSRLSNQSTSSSARPRSSATTDG